jgi:ubiquinone/menaquinone biosynthesis C-methylase UbiE
MSQQGIWENFHASKDMDAFISKELLYFLYKNYYTREKGVKILDLGCGQGNALHYLSKQGFETYGIDYSKEALKKARKNCKDLDVDIMEGDILKLPYADMYFDCIVDCVTLASLESEKLIVSALKECYRVLNPNGLFFFQELSIRTARDNDFLTRQGSIYRFTADEFVKCFLEVGFKGFIGKSANFDDLDLYYLIIEKNRGKT